MQYCTIQAEFYVSRKLKVMFSESVVLIDITF